MIRRFLLRSTFARFPEQLSPGRYAIIDCFFGSNCFPAMWCSAADTHLRLLDLVVSGASFLTGDVIECDLGYRRSVAVCVCCSRSGVINPMRPLYVAIPGPKGQCGYTRYSGGTLVYLLGS